AYREPAGPGVRVDSGVEAGAEVVPLYDPLLAKLCVWDDDRERARRRMLRALAEYVIEGVTTLVPFHLALLSHPCFVEGTTCDGLVESDELGGEAAKYAKQLSHLTTNIARPSDGRARERAVTVEVDGRRYEVRVREPEPPHLALARRRRERRRTADDGVPHASAREAVVSPMQGTVLAVEVAEGDQIEAGRVICVVEAMKMENEIKAHRDGIVTRLSVAPGAAVKTGQVICVVSADGAALPPETALE
ncbi:MAG: carbamoyl phosphate synthase, partial [Thermoleophilia bacterium]|nr:carbamoyl phosphate synthase [Thermoleophilia bacterium]